MSKMMENKAIIRGERFKMIRSTHGYTQEQLANFLKIDRTMLTKFEKGERSLGISVLEKACDLFGCTLLELESSTPYVPLTVAFRAKELTADDMEAISKIQKLVLNTKKKKKLEEKAVNNVEK